MWTSPEPAAVYIVLPAYNEHAVLKGVVESLLPYGYKLVVVDDGSRPALEPALRGLPLYLLIHPVNLGQGAALQTGIRFALSRRAEAIVTFDADGQHDPADIPGMIDALREADVVLGSRFLEGARHNMPGARRRTLRLARYLNFLFTGLLLTDAHNGLRAMTAEAARRLPLRENRMAHATELLHGIREQRLRWTERPVHVRYNDYTRQKGQSLWAGFRIVFDLLLNKVFK